MEGSNLNSSPERNCTSAETNVNGELRAVLRRTASGRSSENTLDVKIQKATNKEEKSLKDVLVASGKRAIGGGVPGGAAMIIQVVSLMWLHTTLNYQYRYGTGTFESMRILYAEGGVRRFYRGVGPALLIGPLSRFGDTAANAGMFTFLNHYESTSNLPIAAKTMCGSFAAGSFRIFLMPVDTLKTVLQVEGEKGPSVLRSKIKQGGVPVLWHGAFGAAAGTMLSHYPWFFTFYHLDSTIPKPPKEELAKQLSRNALIGFCSSFVSDCTSNSLHVIKTTKQTFQVPVSYPETLKIILSKGGVSGLMFRGLKTRIVANGFQGMLFTLLWKYIEEHWFYEESGL
uniref:Mitochondrial carrier protein n=1 Tax=Aplanochytrium stocchinoi TaxID=215587 RepID=A0A7S3PQB5_9STRA|mmetsp:Transcript_20333/g.24641  ORF Transcript_20333/g.24641 Transcript_20333/m.24641 type:complete len:342 (-) Transcript_20333:224-1249(-)